MNVDESDKLDSNDTTGVIESNYIPNPSDALESLFFSAADYYEGLIASLGRAKDTIDIDCYMFNEDQLGKRVLVELAQAINRGVRVRVIVDAVGTSDSYGILDELTAIGALVKVYHPLPWRLGHYSKSIRQGAYLQRFFYFIKSINQRDHRKICIVDGCELWTGSFNFSAQHLSLREGGEGWQDIGVCSKKPFVQDVQAGYEALWHQRPKYYKLRNLKRYLSSLTPRSRKHKHSFLYENIRTARHKLWIVTPYFAPSNSMMQAVLEARQRDVDVRVIVPQESDVILFPLMSEGYFQELLEGGVRVFQYQSGFLHAKALLVDDLCMVGSSNFNHRSFYHDVELDVILQDPNNKLYLQHQFIELTRNSTEITLSNLEVKPWYYWLAKLLQIIRYWS